MYGKNIEFRALTEDKLISPLHVWKKWFSLRPKNLDEDSSPLVRWLFPFNEDSSPSVKFDPYTQGYFNLSRQKFLHLKI